jgi:hypothetical protein
MDSVENWQGKSMFSSKMMASSFGDNDGIVAYCDLFMHLSQDDGCTLACHIDGTDTVFHAIRSVPSFFHHADASIIVR